MEVTICKNIPEFIHDLRAVFEKHGLQMIAPACFDCDECAYHRIALRDDGVFEMFGMNIKTRDELEWSE